MRRAFIFGVMLLWASAAVALEPGATNFPAVMRLSPEGPELLLNGAGERWLMLFKVYSIGLYLPERRNTAAGVLAQKGPKRMLLVMHRHEISGGVIHDYLLSRIGDGSQAAEMDVIKERLEELDRIINGEKVIRRGGTIALDYVPDQGTVIRVNGVPKGAPIPGEDFYNALLKIWIGERAKSTALREALLGRGAG